MISTRAPIILHTPHVRILMTHPLYKAQAIVRHSEMVSRRIIIFFAGETKQNSALLVMHVVLLRPQGSFC